MAQNQTEPTPDEEPQEANDQESSGLELLQDNWLEFLTVVLLAVASLAAAWGGYQAARWGGVQSTLYTRAGAARVESTRAESKAQLLALTDFSIVSECSKSFDTEDEVLQAFAADRPSNELQSAMETCYEGRFGPTLQTAMESWFDTEPVYKVAAPMKETESESESSESDTSGSVQVEELIRQEHAKSELLEGEAGRIFDEGQAANQQSDDYVLSTVFYAMVLFFGGISTRLKWIPLRISFVGFAVLVLTLALLRMASFPVH